MTEQKRAAPKLPALRRAACAQLPHLPLAEHLQMRVRYGSLLLVAAAATITTIIAQDSCVVSAANRFCAQCVGWAWRSAQVRLLGLGWAVQCPGPPARLLLSLIHI